MEIRLDLHVNMGRFFFLHHRVVTRYEPGNDILYLEGNKATGKKNLACSGVQCSLVGLLKGKSFSTDVLLSKETSITLIATQKYENLFFGHPCTYTHRKKRMFPIIITGNIS